MGTTDRVKTAGYFHYLDGLVEFAHSIGHSRITREALDCDEVYDMWNEGFGLEEAITEVMRE